MIHLRNLAQMARLFFRLPRRQGIVPLIAMLAFVSLTICAVAIRGYEALQTGQTSAKPPQRTDQLTKMSDDIHSLQDSLSRDEIDLKSSKAQLEELKTSETLVEDHLKYISEQLREMNAEQKNNKQQTQNDWPYILTLLGVGGLVTERIQDRFGRRRGE